MNYFTSKSKHKNSAVMRIILRDELLPYKCAICGIDSWQGKKINLELNHINNIYHDNRLENLQLLCPNCLSQTITYETRNQKYAKSRYEITDELRDLVWKTFKECGSKKRVSEKLNIRFGVVKKILASNVGCLGNP